MNRKLTLICTTLGWLGATFLFLAGQPGIALADSEAPSEPLFEGGPWSTGTVVIICVVAVIVVALGIFFVWRARAKRRAAGPGAGN